MRRLFLVLGALALGAMGVQAAPPAIPEFNGPRAFQDLVRQVQFGPRVPGTEPHRHTADYLAAELEKAGGSVSLDRWSASIGGKSYPLVNIAATWRADLPVQVMLAAHWDTRPMADQERRPELRDQPVPGANDGASGVAVLLEAARAFGRVPPPVGVTIVFFDGEDTASRSDQMFLGSKRYAERMTRYPRWGILLDMVGDRQLRIMREGFSQDYAPSLMNRIWKTAGKLGHGRVFVNQTGPHVMDDHLSFHAKGVPFANVIDFDYPYWHTTEDTIERCSADSLRIVGSTVLAMVYGER